MKVRGKRSRGNVRRNYFIQEVGRIWSKVPEGMVEVVLSIFMEYLDNFLNCFGFEGYGPSVYKFYECKWLLDDWHRRGDLFYCCMILIMSMQAS